MQKSNQKNPNSTHQSKRHRNNGNILTSACKTEHNKFLHILQDQIYKELERKLQDDGCSVAAKYFNKLVAMEDNLAKIDFRFKNRIRDSHCLLLAIVENVKSAEEAYRTIADRKLTLRLLIQTVHMIQAQDTAFNWLVKEIYKIILKISTNWEEDCSEMLSRVRFEYGVVLAEKDDCLEEAILYMEMSLEKCKGTMWYTNDTDRKFLHQDVSTKLCKTLLQIATINSKINLEMSAGFAERAAKAIYGVGTRESPSLYCYAKLRQSEYLIGNRNYKEAFDVINGIERYIMSNDAPRNKCEFYLWLGICHFNLSPQDVTLALRKFKLSLNLSDSHNFADLKAQTLLYLGKIHSKNTSTHIQARECFIGAKELFLRLRDFENEKLAKYLMAQLRAYQIFPNYLELIKRATENSFCYLYDLMQWQQKLLPFWNEDGQLRHHENEIQCILEENLENTIFESND